jgi:hypothetical protein
MAVFAAAVVVVDDVIAAAVVVVVAVVVAAAVVVFVTVVMPMTLPLALGVMVRSRGHGRNFLPPTFLSSPNFSGVFNQL